MRLPCYSLSTDYLTERGQNPFSFARAWLLAALINEAEQSLQTSSNSQSKSSALLEELELRLKQNADEVFMEELNTVNLFKKPKVRSSIENARQVRQTVKKN